MYKILVVGGTFNEEYTNNSDNKSGYVGVITENDSNKSIEVNSLHHTYGKSSSVVTKLIKAFIAYSIVIRFHNGGKYSDLCVVITTTPNYDLVFWFANVDNSLPKIRDVKEIAPKVMLITSKRNDNNKYTTMEIVQRALATKSNLIFEFSKTNDLFNIRVLDPLGCMWYDGLDIDEAVIKTMHRLSYLRSITRQSTNKSNTSKELVLAWYFDQFKQEQYKSDKEITIPDEQEFIELVKNYAVRFQEILKPGPNVERFLGNASMRPNPPQVGRCSKGMLSFRANGYIFVSQRNIDKQFIDINHFVPCYLENDKVYYCGDNKPSVDTPIQLRLYELLPNINYMIHAHVYMKDAPFTELAIPCGAIEEVSEIKSTIKKYYNDFNGTRYVLNLKGHGSIIMGNSIDDITNIQYYGRPMPEKLN